MQENKKIVWEERATAEALAAKLAQIMREELVGFAQAEKNEIVFTLAGGQQFRIVVEEK